MTNMLQRYQSVLLAFGLGLMTMAVSAEISTGMPAPDFQLQDQYQKPHSLSDYSGQWVVLYFYPKNFTPGCTTEACTFRDDYYQLSALGAEVLGVSLDSADSHAEFTKEYGLPFPLLSDAQGTVAGRYESLRSSGDRAARHTFIIDPQGRVAKVYREVDPDAHSQQVIADIKSLQSR